MRPESRPGEPIARPATVLIVDDSRDQQLLVQAILKRAGFDSVLLAGSAEEALHLLERAGPRPIDLVLLDLRLPGMDGIKACRRIRRCAAGIDLPVIVVTADESDECLETAFSAGATDYIQKPVRGAELVARVRAALRLQAEVSRRKEREGELISITQQLEAMNESLLRLSLLDALTGIGNRRCFDDALSAMWQASVRDKLPLSLVMMDVDLFKTYNDFYGHAAGDACLREVAACLVRSSRRRHDFLARYGGEEFAAVLPETGLAAAVEVAERLRESVWSAAIPREPPVPDAVVTISAGVACFVPARGGSQEDLIKAADEALYAAKTRGRNRVAVAPAVKELRFG
jgi:diguanylate cyclase (GGDEF)-like protein